MKHAALLLLALGTTLSFAQNPPPAIPENRPPTTPVQPAPSTANSTPQRIDLDFPGGTPGELVTAINSALGKNLNVVMTKSTNSVVLPRIKVRSATVADIFTSIATASKREAAIPSRNGSVQYRAVMSQFVPAGGVFSEDSVWSFVSNESEVKDLADLPPTRELRHYQLRPYLADNLSVEDITTAIRTGWEMLFVKTPPDLKFHKETGILIAAGDPMLLEQIPAVLQNLPRTDAAANAPRPPGFSPAIPRTVPATR